MLFSFVHTITVLWLYLLMHYLKYWLRYWVKTSVAVVPLCCNSLLLFSSVFLQRCSILSCKGYERSHSMGVTQNKALTAVSARTVEFPTAHPSLRHGVLRGRPCPAGRGQQRGAPAELYVPLDSIKSNATSPHLLDGGSVSSPWHWHRILLCAVKRYCYLWSC